MSWLIDVSDLCDFRSVPVCGNVFRFPGERHNVHTLPWPSTWPALHTHRHIWRLLDQWYTHTHTRSHISTLTRRAVVAFSPHFQPLLLTQRSSLCPWDGYWHSSAVETNTYSFSWNFYMNAIAEREPHLQGNLQCATKFTVFVAHLYSYTHGHAQSPLRREFLSLSLSLCIRLQSPSVF